MNPIFQFPTYLLKRQAIALAKSGMDLETLAKGQKAIKLVSEIIPAWVAKAVH